VVHSEPSTVADVGDEIAETGLMVAAARAMETHRPDSLAADPFAEHFVRAAASSATWPVRLDEVPDGDADPLWGRLGRYFGLRTRVLDEFLRELTDAGVRQVVLLGVGLDARAFRLDWPAGTVVYELDRGSVLAFKDQVLAGLRAQPRARRVTIAADLREEWRDRLVAAGFDPRVPTAWLAEGLVMYLPGAAERALVDTVVDLSAAGSALAYDALFRQDGNHDIYTSSETTIDVDMLSLFDGDPRPDSAGTLVARGWRTEVRTPFEFTEQFGGRGPRPQPHDDLASNRWVFAHRSQP
jgi:methyltransferase (TIGR00027 family)